METHTACIEGTQAHISGRTGALIVMLHGWPDTHRLWDETVRALYPRWRCVRFDLPGYGGHDPAGYSQTIDNWLSTSEGLRDGWSRELLPRIEGSCR
jgi:pimeloyl-ACP methyl ester carboxylesterase